MIEYWQWLCGNCKVRKSGLPSRAEAIRLGREHIDEKRVAVAQYLDQLANLVDEGALEEAHA